MGWLIFLLILFLLAILPLGASVSYDADGPLVRILAGPIGIKVFPRKKKDKRERKKNKKAGQNTASVKDKKQEKKEKKEKKKEITGKNKTAEKKKGGSVTDFLPLVNTGLAFLGDFRRKLRVNVMYVRLVMAGDDPCDLATNYGRAWAAVGNLFPRLERWFVIKKRDVAVECDFTADKTLITARLDITITLGRLIALVVRYGIRALKDYLNISKRRKGGAQK